MASSSSKEELPTGHTVEEVDQETWERLSKFFPKYDGAVRLQPGGWFTSSYAPHTIKKIFHFEFRSDDIIVMTYPKSGTTWMQEIVWTLLNNPDLDNPKASLSADLRSPHLEVDMVIKPKAIPKIPADSEVRKLLQKLNPEKVNDEDICLSLLEKLPGPRVIKSHFCIPFFPPSMINTSKLIYVARDPRNVIVSKYHFFRVLQPHSYQGTLDNFVDSFVNEEQFSHPYWMHVKAAWDLRNHPNMMFIYFEDLKADPMATIKAVSDFLELSRTPQQIKNVMDYTNFKQLKTRTAEGKLVEPMSEGGVFRNKEKESTSGGIYRKGKSGGWEDDYTETQVKKINAWMEKNMAIFDNDFMYKKEFSK